MPDENRDTVRPFSIKVRCKKCGLEGEISSKDWPIRITGAIEILCPRCGNLTMYAGVYGHSVNAERLRADLKRAGASPPSDEGEHRDED